MDFLRFVHEHAPCLPVQENVLLKPYTTMRVGGMADYFLSISSKEELITALQMIEQTNLPYFVLGNGSNVIFKDEGFRGIVLHLSSALSKITVKGNIIVAQAGALLNSLSKTALLNSLSGLECLSGIPGSVGGAVAMNAGAYGTEIKDVLLSALVLKDLQCVTYSLRDMAYGYRKSAVLQEKSIVLEATFQLKQGNKEEMLQKINCLKEQRKAKQPLTYPSSGSFFKRPEGHFAGALIEQAGLKGFRIGDAMVSEKHAGFVINAGNATAKDILLLSEHIKKEVYERFQVELHEEVRII